MTTANATTMTTMMESTMGDMGLRAIRAYRCGVSAMPEVAWIVDVVTETSITGSGTGATFEAALASAVESTRQSAGQIFYIVQRDGAL
jgi:hypothetical protein